MVHIIPENLIVHLEWSSTAPAPTKGKNITPTSVTVPSATGFTIEDLVMRGKEHYSEKKNKNDQNIGLALALQKVNNYVGTSGMIATMPYLVAGKATAPKKNYLWKKWFSVLSEEHVVIDTQGTFVTAGNPVVITVHGRGILTYDRIMKAYGEGLTPENAAQLTEDEAGSLLKGELPGGENIQIYTPENVQRGDIPNPFGHYAVVTDFEVAKATASGYHNKKDFMDNPLVHARVGTLEYLEPYFKKAKHTDGTVASWHRFAEIDPAVPQGRVLCVDSTDNGLDGVDDLYSIGRFVGVVPEAPGARKK